MRKWKGVGVGWGGGGLGSFGVGRRWVLEMEVGGEEGGEGAYVWGL